MIVVHLWVFLRVHMGVHGEIGGFCIASTVTLWVLFCVYALFDLDVDLGMSAVIVTE